MKTEKGIASEVSLSFLTKGPRAGQGERMPERSKYLDAGFPSETASIEIEIDPECPCFETKNVLAGVRRLPGWKIRVYGRVPSNRFTFFEKWILSGLALA
ncbi:hypothetical protein [Desulfonatronum thiodismutans]|uniref:hypothetical protein n=1 Tax=Desulfonatronum thiodismutans TaxID=159290 RepID=UPI0012692C45|nr:hypothetical protein [Desulfonatronum thiodismutans]